MAREMSYAEAWAKHQTLVAAADAAALRLASGLAERDATPRDSDKRQELDKEVETRQGELAAARTDVSAFELKLVAQAPEFAAALEDGIAPTTAQVWEAHGQLVAEAGTAAVRLNEGVAERDAAALGSPERVEADAKVEVLGDELVDARTEVSAFEWAQQPAVRDALEAKLERPSTAIEKLDNVSQQMVIAGLPNVLEDLAEAAAGVQQIGEGALGGPVGEQIAQSAQYVIEHAPAMYNYAAGATRIALNDLADAPLHSGVVHTYERTPPPVTDKDGPEGPGGPGGPPQGPLRKEPHIGPPTGPSEPPLRKDPPMRDEAAPKDGPPLRKDPPIRDEVATRDGPRKEDSAAGHEQARQAELQALEKTQAAKRNELEEQLSKAMDRQEERIRNGEVGDPDKMRSQMEKVAQEERARLEQRQALEREERAREESHLAAERAR